MARLAFPLFGLGAAYVAFFGYTAATYGRLPAHMASHFDAQGHVNGWMSRASDAGIMTTVALLVPALAIGVMAGADRIPVSFLNVPHRDYWHSPARRKSAIAILRRYAIWFGAANVLFLTGIQGLTVEANQRPPYNLNVHHLEFLTVLYLVIVAVWTLLLLRSFLRLP